PFRRVGTTTSCGAWTICGALGSNPTSAARRPSIWWSESGTVTGGGHLRTHTPGRSTSTWKMEPPSLAVGTRSVDCAFWTGIQRDTNAVATEGECRQTELARSVALHLLIRPNKW